ncbi:hypothetical protein Bbelb_210970 [Branchiostoma belcheri]|nr:hypothetical protein Bbelb_210970 [Branchiostoma belcheri]
MPEVVDSTLKLFADDTKLYRSVGKSQDCQELQNDLDKLQDWASTWQLKFHPQKCTAMRIGKNHPNYKYTMRDNHHSDTVDLQFTKQEKDLGIIVDHELLFDKHVTSSVSKATRMTGLLWRTFEHVDKDVFTMLYKALIRPHLEYGVSTWSPGTWKLAELVEQVQRRATKRVPGIQHLSYEERLRVLKLPTLLYRRLRGDLINTFKFVHGLYDTTPCIPDRQRETRTRGHNLRLKRIATKTNKRLLFFSNRIVPWWNELPEEVVSAPTVTAFKIRFDKYMEHHPVKYSYKALDHPHKPTMTTV